MAKKASRIEELKKRLLCPEPDEPVFAPEDLLSTGCTTLDCACTGRTRGGFAKGTLVWLAGPSDSGKTLLSMSCLAEAAINPNFDNYRFIGDFAEDGMHMAVTRMFGRSVAERLEGPHVGEDGEVYPSSTVEEFYYAVDDAVKMGVPFIYILDSMDALSSTAEQLRFEENKKSHNEGKDGEKGTYALEKAKINSANLRVLRNSLRKTQSICIIVSQARDAIGPGTYPGQRAYAGGRALRLYADLWIETTHKGKIKRTYKGNDVEQGTIVLARVQKNRFEGWKRQVEIPVYHRTGIDNIGAMVSWLLEWGHWKGTKGSVTAPEFQHDDTIELLIRKIQEEALEFDLRQLVGRVWLEIEEKCTPERRLRYS